MSYKKILVHSLLAFTLFSFSSTEIYAQKKKKKSKKSPKQTTQKVSDSEMQLLSDIFLDAMQSKLMGDTDKAKELFRDCLNLAPSNGAANYELALIHEEEKDTETALTYAQTAYNSAPKNKWYAYLYADMLLFNNQIDEATKVYEQQIIQSPNNIENYHKISYIHRMSGNYGKAIEALNELESRMGVIEEISLDKQRLYLQNNDVDGAAGEIEKLINKNPNDLSYYNKLAELYSANRQAEKANEVYARMIKIAPDNPLAQMAMARQYYNKGENAKGAEMLKKVFANPKIDADEKIDFMLGMMSATPQGEELKEAEELTGIIAKAHPKSARIHAVRGDIFMILEDKANAKDAFKRTVELDPNLYPVWEQVMFLEYELQQNENLTKTAKEATELFPNQPLPHYFRGLANLQLKEYSKAVKSLKRTAIIASDNKSLLTEVYSLIGDAYHSMGEHENSDNYYEKSLEIEPKNSLVLNNYAYYLSLRSAELDKAAEMSKLSNEIEPNNSSYQDTYGWILYEQGKYKDAKTWLEKALQNGGDKRPVIVEHYGDILFKLNQKADAKTQWQKALDLGGNKRNLEEKLSR